MASLPTKPPTSPFPFHRLLSFYLPSPPPTNQTIQLRDSLRSNLSLGLDMPAALLAALARHILFRNTGLFSLGIRIPDVPTQTTMLDGVRVDEKKGYGAGEIARLAREKGGVVAGLDALGLWALAARTGGEEKGLLRGEDVVAFQRGELLERVRERRRGRGDVLPLWRGGPIWVGGHSWAVGWLFGVDVYKGDGKID